MLHQRIIKEVGGEGHEVRNEQYKVEWDLDFPSIELLG